MSHIEELRNSKKNNINLIKVLESLFPNKKTKYVEMMSKIFFDYYPEEFSTDEDNDFFDSLDTSKLNDLEKYFLISIIRHSLYTDQYNDLIYFMDKCETNNKGIDVLNITCEDIDKYVEEFREDDLAKQIEQEIHKIYEDDEWLVLVPLSEEASCKYGRGTKWCVAAKNESSYNAYIRDGILVYVINKKSSYKRAIYYELKDYKSGYGHITVWDEEDDQHEIFLTDIPESILNKVRVFFKEHPESTKKFVEDQEKEEDEDNKETFFDIETPSTFGTRRAYWSSDGRYFG